jgi:hypothetical protein
VSMVDMADLQPFIVIYYCRFVDLASWEFGLVV